MTAERLKELRKDKGMTQIEVCKILNMSQHGYASWEQGRTEPNIGALVKLSMLFECSVDYLVGKSANYDFLTIHTELTPQQNELINGHARLNADGKARLLGYLSALLSQPIFTRN